MPGLGHLPELLVVCLVALLIFGPKRVIEMGSALGKAVRELRESTKDLNWTSLLGGSEPTKSAGTSLGALSQLTQSLSNSLRDLQGSPTTASSVVIPPTGQSAVESESPMVSEQRDMEGSAQLPEETGAAEQTE